MHCSFVIYTIDSLYLDHLWHCPKVVFKTTFEQYQRWSIPRVVLGVEKKEEII